MSFKITKLYQFRKRSIYFRLLTTFQNTTMKELQEKSALGTFQFVLLATSVQEFFFTGPEKVEGYLEAKWNSEERNNIYGQENSVQGPI